VVLADGSRAHLGPLDESGLASRLGRAGLEGEIYRGLQALLANGSNRETIRAGTPRYWRRCGGYNLDRLVTYGGTFKLPADRRFNLAKLVCGAEGGLAVMTDATLGLVPVPRRRGLATLQFGSLNRALTAVPDILEVDPAAVELVDDLGLQLCREAPQYARLLDTFVEGRPHSILVCEFHGESTAEVEAGLERLGELVRRRGLGVDAVVPIVDPARQQNVWTVRKVALGLLMSMPGDYKPIPFIEDGAVPVENLAEYVAEIQRFVGDLGSRIAYYAHVSAGCLHIRPLIDTKQAAEIAKMPEILSFAVELLHGYGGALSSEHGDGRARSWINERFFGPDLYRLYQQVKQTFDPRALLNPGTVVEAPPMTESLRFGEDYQTVESRPLLDFGPEQGFAGAIEMCNGAGVCRRRGPGTMCPSFRVTREEEHSTRGRANALRAAMSGLLPVEELGSRRMYEVMDLCVECKACKTECPSSVDMTKIKAEFLAGYHAAHGVSLRERLVGGFPRLSRLASGRLAPLVNATLASRPSRLLMDRMMGIDRRRTIPAFARRPFTRWFEQQAPRPSTPRGRVVLFNDTYNTYSTPEVAQAATELLVAAGLEVGLPGHGCCGRPMLSKGLIEQARRAASETVERLAPLAAEGLPIIGLEPSCVSALQDDYPYLLPDDERVASIAAAVESFEEWIVRAAEAGEIGTRRARTIPRAVFHGHCHQKALDGTESLRRALELVADEVVEIASGCCGMAGSFGYESEHYDISLAMAEDRLLPAVRDSEGAALVTSGVSCRQQIEHGTGRRALHPAQLLHEALIGSS
jgi:Fe-S oxidoreductase/FAD/FMN-containing dehydrogenase